LALIACRSEPPPPPPPPPTPSVDATSPPPRIVDAAPLPIDASAPILDAGPRHAQKAKSIGHTSVVLKIEQTDGKKIVWKPDSRIGRGRYRGEIAAYRLAVLLGIDNVPPAVPLDIARDELARAASGDAKAKELF
jgi:hypothetical protein